MIKDIKSGFLTDEVFAIYSACMGMPTRENFAAKAAAYIADENVCVYGFYDEDALVGIIAARNLLGGKYEIPGIAVEYSHRNARVGARLIEHVLKIDGLRELVAETDGDAVDFYRKCGFQTESFIKKYGSESITRYRCRRFA